MSDKPVFDPAKPFEAVTQDKPAFDPNKSFEPVDSQVPETSLSAENLPTTSDKPATPLITKTSLYGVKEENGNVRSTLPSIDSQLPHIQAAAQKAFSEHPEIFADNSARLKYVDSLVKPYSPKDQYKIVRAVNAVDPYYQEQLGNTLIEAVNPSPMITSAVGAAASGILHGAKTVDESATMIAQKNPLGFLHAAVGVGQGTLGVLSAVQPELAAFNVVSESVSDKSPAASKLMAPIASNLEKKYKEAGLTPPTWKNDLAEVGDFFINALAFGLVHGGKKIVDTRSAIEDFQKGLDDLTPAQIDAIYNTTQQTKQQYSAEKENNATSLNYTDWLADVSKRAQEQGVKQQADLTQALTRKTVPAHFNELDQVSLSKPVSELPDGISVNYQDKDGHISRDPQTNELLFNPDKGKSEVLGGGAFDPSAGELGIKINEGKFADQNGKYFVEKTADGHTVYKVNNNGKIKPVYESETSNVERRDAIIKKALERSNDEASVFELSKKAERLQQDAQNNKENPTVAGILTDKQTEVENQIDAIHQKIAEENSTKAVDATSLHLFENHKTDIENSMESLSAEGKDAVKPDLDKIDESIKKLKHNQVQVEVPETTIEPEGDPLAVSAEKKVKNHFEEGTNALVDGEANENDKFAFEAIKRAEPLLKSIYDENDFDKSSKLRNKIADEMFDEIHGEGKFNVSEEDKQSIVNDISIRLASAAEKEHGIKREKITVAEAQHPSTAEKQKKQEYRKVRDEKLSAEISDLWADFSKDSGKLSTGIDPERLAKAVHIVSKYAESGVYKLADIIDDAYSHIGEKVHDLLDEIKAAYLAHQRSVPDEVLDQMDEVKTVRNFKAKDYGNSGNKEHSRPDGAKVSSDTEGEQPGLPVADIPERNTGEKSGGEGEESNRPSGQTGKSGKNTKRSSGDRERNDTGNKRQPKSGGEGNATRSVEADSKPDRSAKVEDQNHVIGTADEIVPKGDSAKIKANINAIKLLKKLEKEDRNPTPEEKKVLVQFSGWGGLANVLDQQKADNRGDHYREDTNWTKKYGKVYDEVKSLMNEDEFNAAVNSTINAHYTSAPVIKGLWDIAKRLGFKGGNILESSAGIGHILGLAPKDIADNSRFVGYELDSFTGRMLKKLYPEANINVQGFEKSKIPPNSMDMAITNVPFGREAPYDKNNPELSKFSLHNYFIAKNLTQLKPGGLGIFITSSSSMDAPVSEKFRTWVGNEGNSDFLGAIRLPNTAFDENAKTQVTTDIMVFRKRDGGPLLDTEPFKITVPISEAKTKEGEPVNISVNEYYAKHPDMMLGEMKLAHDAGSGGLYSGDSQTLAAKKGMDIAAEFKKAIAKLPEDVIKERHDQEEHLLEMADDNHKEGSLVLKDGKVKLVTDGALEAWKGEESVRINGKIYSAEKIAKDYIGIKSVLNDLVAKELSENLSDADIETQREKLNKEYDTFTKKYGTFSRNRALEKLLGEEYDYPLLQSIENAKKISETDEGGKIKTRYEVTKEPIFSKRVNHPRIEPSSAENIGDAMAISQSWRGNIDLPYISKLTGIPEAVAKAHIIDEGLGFENPDTGLLEGRDQYLSGFVREKLKTAEEKGYDKNAEALKKVIPDDIPIGAIQFRLGSRFIPEEGVQDFVSHLTDAEVRVRYIDQTGTWTVQKIRGEYSPKNTQEYAGGGIPAIDLIEKALNSKQPEVRVKHADGTTNKDVVATLQAQQKMQEINQAFIGYIRENKKLIPDIEKTYNETANGYVERKQDLPKFKHFPGASSDITLRDHQKLAVIRGVSESTLLAHEVGTGKTYTMQTIAMERKRLGLAKKNLVVVKKATIEDFVSKFRKLYPQAKILAPTEEQMSAKNRGKLFAKIKTGDYDAIVITEPQLDKIPDDPNRIAAYVNEQINSLQSMADQSDDRNFKKEIDGQIKKLQGVLEKNLDMALGKEEPESKTDKVKDIAKKQLSIEKRLMRQSDRTVDNTINFEDMGIDSIIIDEAHGFKRLGFMTNMTRIKGIDTQGAKKSLSALMKIRHIQERTQGKNVTMATGTPISNTMAEAWTMMNYLRPDVLQKYGIQNFDQFATTFGEVVPSLEYTAGGTFKVVDRFSKFSNVPELLKAWRSVADIVLTDDVREFKENDLIPKANKVSIQLPQTEGVRNAIAGFRRELEEWQKLSGKQKMENRHIPLTVFNKAKQAAIDLRMIDPSAEDETGSKTNRVINEVFDRWKDWEKNKTTQLVFSDMYQSPESKNQFLDEDRTIPNPSYGKGRFNLYEDMKNKLIEKGIPKEEIAIIHDHDTPARREALWEKINAGDVRILFGSTEKSGTGVNVQDKLGAIHHVDAPARPMDFTQRNGRGIRQGNENKSVDITTYGVEKSLDATSYQRLAIKDAFIKQMMKGNITDRTMEDIGDETDMGFDEMMANLSGNQHAIVYTKKKYDLQGEISKQKAHENATITAQRNFNNSKLIQKVKQQRVEDFSKAIDKTQAWFEDGAKSIVTDGKTTVEKDIPSHMDKFFSDADAALTKDAGKDKSQMIVKVNGRNVNIEMRKKIHFIDGKSSESIEKNYSLDEGGKDPVITGNFNTGNGLLKSIAVQVKNMPEKLKSLEDDLKREQTNSETYRRIAEKPFDDSKVEALKKEVDQLADLMKEDAEKESASSAENSETPAEKETNYDKVAKKIRKGKISDDIAMASVPFIKEVWNGALEVLAQTVKATGQLHEGIQKAIEYIRDTDWYKSLSKDDQVDAEEKFADHANNNEIEGKNYSELLNPNKGQEVSKEEVEQILTDIKSAQPGFKQRLANAAKGNVVSRIAVAAVKTFHPFIGGTKNNPSIYTDARLTAMTLREHLGEMQHNNELAAQGSKEKQRFFDKLDQADQIRFIANLERGVKTGEPMADALSADYNKRFDAVYDQINKIKDLPYIEDYFPHFWKDPEKAKQIFSAIYSKRPMEGSKSFLKQRFYSDVIEGMKNGLELVSTNPEDLARLAEINANKFTMANDFFDALKEQKLVQYINAGKFAPEGWSKVDDPLFNAKIISDKLKGGGWYMPDDAADIIKRYTSRSMVKGDLTDVIRNYNNVLNQAQLGISFFHGMTTTIDAGVTANALGLDRISRGLIGKGLWDITKGTTLIPNMIEQVKIGDKAIKDYRSGVISDDVRRMIVANARTGMDVVYHTNMYDKFRRAITKSNYGEALLRSVPAAVDLAAKPIFEYMVPRLKVGGFVKLAENELSKLQNPTPEEINRTIQKSWDNIENRLGQMTYDNLFWDKTTKDIAFLVTRSVGWNLGTARAFSGAVADIPSSAKSLVKGKGISPRTAWALALVGQTALMGAITTYLSTGQAPQDWKDYFYPRTGEKNKDGTEKRVQFPTYMKEVFNTYDRGFYHTAVAKASPFVNEVAEIMENKDFYGEQVYDPMDPAYKKGLEVLQYGAKQFIPFGFRDIPGEPPTEAESVRKKFGVMPAPAHIQTGIDKTTIFKNIENIKADQEDLKKKLKYGKIDSTAYENKYIELQELKQAEFLKFHANDSLSTVSPTIETNPRERKQGTRK